MGWYPVRKRQKTVRKSSRCCPHSLISTKSSIPESVAQSTKSKTSRSGYRTRHRSEEHTSELQSLMHISYAVFCLKKKNNIPSIKTRKNNTDSMTRYTTVEERIPITN